VTEKEASGYVGAIGHKTYNTHLHVMEALAELYRVWPDAKVKDALAETILINTSTVLHPDVNANVDAWSRDWKMIMEPRNLRASYGHDVECVWLVMDAAKTAGMNKGVLLPWAESLAANSIKYGYDQEHGGFYQGGDLDKSADDKRKTWWIQAEALPGMLELYRLTGKRQYYDIFAKTLEFCQKYQVAKEGSWWATRAEDGSATNDKQRSSPWQGAYHVGRSMIVCAEWLDELAGK
jgi:cellobiose epimerase